MIKYFSKLKRSEGFTLLELMVVIGILAIMMLAAVPSYLGHQQDAEVNNVMRDTKTLEDAAMNYLIDVGNDDWPVCDENDIGEGDFEEVSYYDDEEGFEIEEGVLEHENMRAICQTVQDELTQRLYNDLYDEDGNPEYALIYDVDGYEGYVVTLNPVDDSDGYYHIHPDINTRDNGSE